MSTKYFNRKTIYKGKIYDSKKEAKRAYELDMMQRAGLIHNLERQKSFELQPSFKLNGKTIRAITYIADFVYTKNGQVIVEDVKGSKKTLTEVYRIKKKLFLYRYPQYIFIEFI